MSFGFRLSHTPLTSNISLTKPDQIAERSKPQKQSTKRSSRWNTRPPTHCSSPQDSFSTLTKMWFSIFFYLLTILKPLHLTKNTLFLTKLYHSQNYLYVKLALLSYLTVSIASIRAELIWFGYICVLSTHIHCRLYLYNSTFPDNDRQV